MFKSSFWTYYKSRIFKFNSHYDLYIYILRMANYKYQKNTQEIAMETNSKSMIHGLVCEFHATYFSEHEISYKKSMIFT